KERPFYGELVQMMSSGPIVTMVIEGENAVSKLREVVGATDPKKAAVGTIREVFGSNITDNAIHASDSLASATREIPFFFTEQEIF
ncbi:MAG: nucleoside-diphosphate kinase, partial [Verrucomicrobia bacterium]|nr:nucleoside-diphosphate kinase [Verrucomicrobiota bacterium]